MPGTSFPLIAFGFVSPWLLWGLALGGVPILIQWLHRRKYTQRVWAAMRFLRAATKSQSRRLRFESLLLLAIRTLILLLAALALAEPFLETPGWLPESASNVHRLIVVDTSLSMAYELEGRSVRERSREAARSLIAEGRPGDSYQIVTLNRAGHALVSQPAFDSTEVLAELDRLSGSEELGDPGVALDLALQLLSESPSRRQRQVSIISDFQRSNWWPETPSERIRMKEALAELSQAAELSIVNVGLDEWDNAAITHVQADPALATVGMPVHITASIQSQPGSTRSLPVELVEDDRIVQTEKIELSKAGQATVEFTTLSPDAGTRRLEIRLPDDGLTSDNHRWITVDVKEELAVLLVNGRESGESLGRATDFVEVALAPEFSTESRAPSRAPGRIGYRPVVVNEAEFTRTELTDYDCIVLCDVPFLSETESARLDRFVRSGGGLIVGLGDQIQPDAYNQWMNAAGSSLLPVQLIQIRGGDNRSSEPFRFEEPLARHPIVDPFLGNPQAGLTTANIYRYYETRFWAEDSGRSESAAGVPRPVRDRIDRDGSNNEPIHWGAAPARLAIAFDNGDPAIVEREYGMGRILLVTTSLDDRWGSWALWPSFLPMVHRMVQYAVSTRAERTWFVGDRLHREYPVQTVGMPVTVQRPDGRRASGQSTLQSGATTVASSQTRQSGFYRFVLGPPLNDTEVFAVNVDPRESDLRTLSDAELARTLLSGIDARLSRPGESAGASRVANPPQGHLTRWLLVVVLILVIVEQIMAWSARSGLVALVTSPLLVAGFSLYPAASILVLGASLAMLLMRRYGMLGWLR